MAINPVSIHSEGDVLSLYIRLSLNFKGRNHNYIVPVCYSYAGEKKNQMKTFQKYLNLREALTAGVTDDPGSPDSQDVQEMFKTVWNRYRDSLLDFVKGLSEDNEDDDLKALINKLNGGGSDLPSVSKAGEDGRDEVVPPNSDRGGGEGEGSNN